jgi:branched-chain amino acid aminotransferase
MEQLYLDGKWLNAEKAGISVNNRSFRYGDGFFETMKCINYQLPLWKYHEQRLFDSLEALFFQKQVYFTGDFLKETILELVKKNQVGKLARIRVTIFRGDGGIYDAVNHRPNLLIQTWPVNPENNKLNENGLVIGDYPGGFKATDAFANLKSNNYLLYAMGALYAKKQQWNDALIFNHTGSYCDATIANLWLVKNGQIFTPPLSDGPVAGVMRQFLLDNLKVTKTPVIEKSLTPGDLQLADEVFFTNAIYGIKWVKNHGFKPNTYQLEMAAQLHAKFIAPLWASTK